MSLTFEQLQKANRKRSVEVYHPIEEWSPQDWSNAMAGETGEVCNITKKMRRGDPLDPAFVTLQLSDEIADVVIYADLLAQRLNLSLEECIKRKFNKTSHKKGSTVILGDSKEMC